MSAEFASPLSLRTGRRGGIGRSAKRFLLLLPCIVPAVLGPLAPQARAQTPAPDHTSAGPVFGNDLVQFLDGSLLHGKLQSINREHGVEWQHPDAKSPIAFTPTNIAWVRFDQAKAAPGRGKPTCRFRFTNGDEVFGQLTSVNTNEVQLETWFGGALTTPRSALQSVAFLSKGYTVLYEGPSSLDGWVQGRSGSGWEYRDGAFVTAKAGTLGRNLNLSGSTSLSFDLAWNGQFGLILALFTSVLDRFDYGSSSYMFCLSPSYCMVQRVQGGAGAMNLGQVQIPEMSKKNRVHLELRANKEEATLGLFVDDRLVQRWKDNGGFIANGPGLVLFSQIDGPSVRVSNMKVAQWEGDFGLDTSTNAPTSDDVVFLANRDKVRGKLGSVQDGTLKIMAAEMQLSIPLNLVNQVAFGTSVTNSVPLNPWQLRAYFAGGGNVSFELNRWANNRVEGTSANFGRLQFNPEFVRQFQFNLDRARPGSAEIEPLDQEVWDIE